MPSGRNNEVEVITGVQRRRRWTPAEKLEWVRKTMEPGMSVSLVAREAGITASRLFGWRKAYTEGSLVAEGANEPVVPASELQDAMKRIKQLDPLEKHPSCYEVAAETKASSAAASTGLTR